MQAVTITVQGFPLLHLEDKVSFALQCMEDFDVQELAVVKEDYFLGRTMDVFITKLRKYVKADPTVVLETIHGVGFRLLIN